MEQVIPLGRVWSFPKQIVIASPAQVRFIRAWDPLRNMMVNRFDVLYGFGVLENPQTVEQCEVVKVRLDSEVPNAMERLTEKYGCPPPRPLVVEAVKRMSKSDQEIRGIWYDEPLAAEDLIAGRT
jgi:hypothetical protein